MISKDSLGIFFMLYLLSEVFFLFPSCVVRPLFGQLFFVFFSLSIQFIFSFLTVPQFICVIGSNFYFPLIFLMFSFLSQPYSFGVLRCKLLLPNSLLFRFDFSFLSLFLFLVFMYDPLLYLQRLLFLHLFDLFSLFGNYC